jgi:cytochrome oxidase Cu insertion factor (SCO1/SenC/PrrC family)
MHPQHLLRRLLCVGLLAMGGAGSGPGLAAGAAAGPAGDDAAAEAKAREYFSDLEVFDQDGNPLRFYSDVLKDRIVLINFIFTNCPGACPLMTQKLKQVRQLLDPSVRDDIWFVSVSIDPERDTPAAMKAFAQEQGVEDNRWVFVTGKKQNLEFIVKRLGQYTEEVEVHSTLMLAGNTRTRHWTRVQPMVPPPGVAAKLTLLAEEAPVAANPG